MNLESGNCQVKRLIGMMLPWGVAFVMLFLHLGSVPLIAPDEGRNAEVAREMFENGAWLVPTYDGIPYLDKPAFFFKSVALAYAFFGVSEFAARLPSALFGLALLGVVYVFARRQYDRLTARIAVMVLATTPLYMAFSRLVIFDMTLAFFVCSSIFAGFLAETGPDSTRKRWYLAAVALGSLATLVKGPVGFLIPLLVLVVFSKLDGRPGALKRLFAPVHWLLFLAIVAPWFFGLTLQHPDFAYYGIVKESLSRFGTAEFRRTQPFYYYAFIIATCVLPWSTLLPESAWVAWKSRRNWSSADRLLVVWVVVVVLFFSVSQSKLPGYILSAVVALGLLMARVVARALAGAGGRSEALVMRGAIAVALIAGAGALFLFIDAGETSVLPEMLKIPSEQWGSYATSLRAVGLSLTALALLGMLASVLRRPRMALAAFLLLPLALMTVNFDLLAHYMEGRSARALAERLPPLPADTEIGCLRCFPPGLSFYLRKYITVITDDAHEFTSNYIIFSLRSSNLHSERVVNGEDLKAWFNRSGRPIYLMAEAGGKAQLERIAGRRHGQMAQLNERYWGALFPSPVVAGQN